MTIVFVIDNFGILTNGTTMTAWRFVDALREKGNTVRIVCVGADGPDIFRVEAQNIPIVSKIAEKQSIVFGKPDKEVFTKAFNGADVIHFFMPWRLASVGKKIADEMGIPVTAAFHVQPENITYGIGLGPSGAPAARLIYFIFLRYFYRRFEHIHCPSSFIAGELRKNGYNAKLHIFSNGVGPDFNIAEEQNNKGYFNILMTGRYAPEKRQEILIRAVDRSRHRDRIRLTLAGAGPMEKKLRYMARHLPQAVRFGFQSQQELIETIRSSDLYVHTADIEIEAISCLEAIACGKIPVIADSRKSATRQFALDERSLFKSGSVSDLAKKIDYWIEHEEERRVMSQRYRDLADIYRLEYSVRKAENMFREAIRGKADLEISTSREGKKYRKKLVDPLPLRFVFLIFYFAFAIPILAVLISGFMGLRIKNRRSLLKAVTGKGAVTVSNHVHVLDSAMAALAMLPKKLVFTSIPENFRLPVAGFFVRALGAVPTPTNPTENRIFFKELAKKLRSGRIVHMFPEGDLRPLDPHLRRFRKGAFHLAVKAQVPIIPIVITFPETGNKFLRHFRKTGIVLKILPPVYPDLRLLPADAENELKLRVESVMLQEVDGSGLERSETVPEAEAQAAGR